MKRVTTTINLGNDAYRLELEEAAYEELRRYLAGAENRLRNDPDRDEVLGDLERAIGEKLESLQAGAGAPVDAAALSGVLEQVGTVDVGESTGEPVLPPPASGRERKRRLWRIRDKGALSGICKGLAVYSDLDVALVRSIFVLGTVFTGGLLGVVYLIMMFVVPPLPAGEAPTAAGSPAS